jgi:hypothetical protein
MLDSPLPTITSGRRTCTMDRRGNRARPDEKGVGARLTPADKREARLWDRVRRDPEFRAELAAIAADMDRTSLPWE